MNSINKLSSINNNDSSTIDINASNSILLISIMPNLQNKIHLVQVFFMLQEKQYSHIIVKVGII